MLANGDMKSLLRAILLFSLIASYGFSASANSRQDDNSLDKYAKYYQLLEKYWPLQLGDTSACQSHDPQVWINKAEAMISVEPFRRRLNLNSDEVMVLRNLLVSQAYNRVFTHSLRIQNSDTPMINFFWIAAGSQASVTVGHALQEGLAKKYPKGSRQNYVFSRLEARYPDLPIIPKLLLNNISQVKRKTAENNWRVYSDLMWQHLAYMTCGYDEAVKLNRVLIAKYSAQNNATEVDHYKRFISVWTDIAKGRPRDANMKLIYVEQYQILQKYMYDGLDAQAANAMLVFNSMAKADLSGPHGRPIQSFTEYSISQGLYPNLGYFPHRYKWMKYVVGEQIDFIQELASPDKIEAALTRSLEESYQLVNDYLGLL